jgi:Caenorhabditis protein of unknown function, DUF268
MAAWNSATDGAPIQPARLRASGSFGMFPEALPQTHSQSTWHTTAANCRLAWVFTPRWASIVADRPRRTHISSVREKQSYVTGFHPRILLRSLAAAPTFLSDWFKYQRLNSTPQFRLKLRDAFPILTDRHASAGLADGVYFHQDLWAARKIFQKRPRGHVDIGSRVDGFVAHILAFMPVTIVDIRPLISKVQGLTFLQDDATLLSMLADNSVSSLSSLHAAEHFGLGRYSDPIDPDACFKFMDSLQRVLALDGKLYFSVPVGRERVEFNAHRVFSPGTILARFSKLKLDSFSYVGDDGSLYENTAPLDLPNSEMACGLFEFTKIAD